jgi:putative transposase
MKVTRSDQIYIRNNETISMMCHYSKNLFNQTNYILRQQFMKGETMTGYSDLVKQFQIPDENYENNNYQKLPAQTAQWTIKKVKQSWNSFFKARRAWKKYPEKFLGMPKPPKYKEKNGEFMLIFTNQQCSIHHGILKFPKIMKLDLRTRLDNVNLREVRLIPQGMGYVIEIVHEKDVSDVEKAKPVRIMGIDMGVRNIVTVGDSISKDGCTGSN